eukprot:9828947-Alexandrium_andersonii.AAC.1
MARSATSASPKPAACTSRSWQTIRHQARALHSLSGRAAGCVSLTSLGGRPPGGSCPPRSAPSPSARPPSAHPPAGTARAAHAMLPPGRSTRRSGWGEAPLAWWAMG